MNFLATPLVGLYVIELEPLRDARGLFARSYCAREFERLGLEASVAQCNISFNAKVGTLRGLHFQVSPHEEAKLVRCTEGAIFDVAVDIRRESPTYLKWHAVELTRENRRMVFIPRGFAHGFQTLADNTEVFYQMSNFYDANSGDGLRWNDPALAITWPVRDPIISDKDRAFRLIDERSI